MRQQAGGDPGVLAQNAVDPAQDPARPPPQSPKAAPVAPVTGPPLGPPAAPGAVKVALLVPQSGPNADLGKSMLEAAQLALFETGSDRLTLVPRDTGGTAEGAANAAR